MAARKTGPGQVLASERERTLASAVRRRAAHIYSVQRSFEEAGCSCKPYRERLDELEQQYKTEQRRLLYPLEHSDMAREIEKLKTTVDELDSKEHPALDAAGRKAEPYLTVWLMDQVREGNAEILTSSDPEIGAAYAQAWMGGWRPKSLFKAKRSASK